LPQIADDNPKIPKKKISIPARKCQPQAPQSADYGIPERKHPVRLFFWALNGNLTPLEPEKLTKFGVFSPLWRTRFRNV
jgi:hypothetical protein